MTISCLLMAVDISRFPVSFKQKQGEQENEGNREKLKIKIQTR